MKTTLTLFSTLILSLSAFASDVNCYYNYVDSQKDIYESKDFYKKLTPSRYSDEKNAQLKRTTADNRFDISVAAVDQDEEGMLDIQITETRSGLTFSADPVYNYMPSGISNTKRVAFDSGYLAVSCTLNLN